MAVVGHLDHIAVDHALQHGTRMLSQFTKSHIVIHRIHRVAQVVVRYLSHVTPRKVDRMADDTSIREHIADLVATERELRERLASHEISAEEEHGRLRVIEAELDQCWDLLRQRDARREFGANPDEARARSEAVVEDYKG